MVLISERGFDQVLVNNKLPQESSALRGERRDTQAAQTTVRRDQTCGARASRKAERHLHEAGAKPIGPIKHGTNPAAWPHQKSRGWQLPPRHTIPLTTIASVGVVILTMSWMSWIILHIYQRNIPASVFPKSTCHSSYRLVELTNIWLLQSDRHNIGNSREPTVVGRQKWQFNSELGPNASKTGPIWNA